MMFGDTCTRISLEIDLLMMSGGSSNEELDLEALSGSSFNGLQGISSLRLRPDV